MKRTLKTISVAVIFFILCKTSATEDVVLPATAGLIPPETVFLADVHDFSQLKQQFEKTSIYKFYKDPAMADFVENVKSKWREKMQQRNENDIFKAVVDENILPQGRVAFALVLNKQAIDVNEPMALFITQWGQNTSKIKEAVDKAVKKAIEDGLHQSSEDYRGINIKTIIAEGSSRLGYGFSSKLSYCFFDDCLIGSEDIEVLKFVIAHIKGATSPTLASDSDYNASVASVGPYQDIVFYINIKQIIKTATAEDSSADTKSIITNLGLDNVASAGGSIGFARRPGCSASGKAFLKIDGLKKGICKMLDMESAALRAPRFIPQSVYSLMFLNLNVSKAYSEFVNILNSFSPEAAAVMYVPLLPDSPDGQPGVQLKRDIIDHLGSQVIIAQSLDKPFSDTSTPPEGLFALAANNPKSLEKSLSTLHSKFIAADNPDAKRELLGHTIYLLDFSALLPAFSPGERTPMQKPADSAARLQPCDSLQDEQVPPKMPTLAFTVTDTHLIFGLESTVERAVRTLSSSEAVSLSSAKWFTSAKSAIEPSVVGLACLEDNSTWGEFFWWLMEQTKKTKDEDSSLSVGVKMDSSSLFPHMMLSQAGLFDTGLLPSFDVVRKYFGLTALYGLSTADGFFFEFNYLNPTATE